MSFAWLFDEFATGREETGDAAGLLRELNSHLKESDAELLRLFFRWLVPRWDRFWASFQPDGTMTLKEFRRFVFWDGNWQAGSCHRLFGILEGEDGVIHARTCLNAKIWFFRGGDKMNVTTNDCRQTFVRFHSSLGRAWRLVLDPDDLGNCTFNHFCRKCHEIGIKRNLGTIWADLTHGYTDRSIHYRDFDPDGDRLLSYFATALALRADGGLREGWDQMCREFGGKVKLANFVDFCQGITIETKKAKQLFGILDPRTPEHLRCLSEFDRLTFFGKWDPGEVSMPYVLPFVPLRELKKSARERIDIIVEEEKRNTFDTPTSHHPYVIAAKEAYEIVLVLSREEHEEYKRRARHRLAVAGAELFTPRSARTPRSDRTIRPRDLGGALWQQLTQGVSPDVLKAAGLSVPESSPNSQMVVPDPSLKGSINFASGHKLVPDDETLQLRSSHTLSATSGDEIWGE